MTSAFGNYYTHRQALVKILLMLLRNYCAKIATKKRKHNTNSTGMSVNLVVCACGFILIRSRKGQGSALLACPKADGFIQPALTGKASAQSHAMVNARSDKRKRRTLTARCGVEFQFITVRTQNVPQCFKTGRAHRLPLTFSPSFLRPAAGGRWPSPAYPQRG